MSPPAPRCFQHRLQPPVPALAATDPQYCSGQPQFLHPVRWRLAPPRGFLPRHSGWAHAPMPTAGTRWSACWRGWTPCSTCSTTPSSRAGGRCPRLSAQNLSRPKFAHMRSNGCTPAEGAGSEVCRDRTAAEPEACWAWGLAGHAVQRAPGQAAKLVCTMRPPALTAPAGAPPPCSDEAAMLQRLHELNPQLIRRISRRIFFVVNKMDIVRRGWGGVGGGRAVPAPRPLLEPACPSA